MNSLCMIQEQILSPIGSINTTFQTVNVTGRRSYKFRTQCSFNLTESYVAQSFQCCYLCYYRAQTTPASLSQTSAEREVVASSCVCQGGDLSVLPRVPTPIHNIPLPQLRVGICSAVSPRMMNHDPSSFQVILGGPPPAPGPPERQISLPMQAWQLMLS